MGYPEISGRKRGGRGGSKETCNSRVQANLNHDHVTPSSIVLIVPGLDLDLHQASSTLPHGHEL